MADYFTPVDGLACLILGFVALLAAVAIALAALRNCLDGARGDTATHRKVIGTKLAIVTGLVLFGLAVIASSPEPPLQGKQSAQGSKKHGPQTAVTRGSRP